jgi:ABC-type Fe3+/spermidine/putrescine transport system ATPase subunit
MNELRGILKRVGMTALYVTHDQEEAFAVADRVLIMRANPERGRGGWIEQEGTPAEVYRRPATEYVARFLGFRNLLPGALLETFGMEGYCRVSTPVGELVVAQGGCERAPGSSVTVLVRPEAAALPAQEQQPVNLVRGTLVSASFRGSFYLIQTSHPNAVTLTLELSASEPRLPAEGQPVLLILDPHAITLLTGS